MSPDPAPRESEEAATGDGERSDPPATDSGGGPPPYTAPDTPDTAGTPDAPAAPSLPEGPAVLPDLAPGGEALAELPLVAPSEAEEPRNAGSRTALEPSLAPAILLASLLLSVLLALPLAPRRRVRTGGTQYTGRRRRSW